MKNNIMSFEELDTMRRNLDMLESSLGYPVPQHLLNSEDLSEHILSFPELDTMSRNIDMLDSVRNHAYSGGYRNRKDLGWFELWPAIMLIVLFILALFD